MATKLTTAKIKSMFKDWFQQTEEATKTTLTVDDPEDYNYDPNKNSEMFLAVQDVKNWKRGEKVKFKTWYGSEDDPSGAQSFQEEGGVWKVLFSDAVVDSTEVSRVAQSGRLGDCVFRRFYTNARFASKYDVEGFSLEVVTDPEDQHVLYWCFEAS